MCNSQQDDDELRLVKDLFDKGYNKNVRPVGDKNLPVEVKFGIAYTQIVDLNEKDQVLESNIWVRMHWKNHLLQWNESEYGGITTINITPKKMWLPDIVLHNNAEENLPSGTLYQFKTKVMLTNNGGCTWYAPTILRSGCNIDITYFPFDDQLCELKFGSWTFNGLQVNIVQMEDEADLKFYMKSSEFKLISAKAKRNVVTYSCCPEPYPDITFYIHVRRDPVFYLFNIIIPCMVLTLLSVMTFLLPPEFGERITLVIESFFAMAVIILNVSDQIPVSSDATPILMRLLMAAMFQIGGCLLANAIALNMYKRCEVPEWVRVVILHYMSRCLFMRTYNPTAEVQFPAAPNEYKIEDLRTRQQKLAGAKLYHGPIQSSPRMTPNLDGLGHKPRQDPVDAYVLSRIVDGYEALARQADRQDDADIDREFWSFVCMIVDRLFLILFFCMITGSYWNVFSQVPAHYDFPF
ncbi:hypothetical protein QZH41_012734 [Actinostola sp. cb2023]|nr:hypothetical protein QZH41_012734 [Actinostola sp. cb2023]